jgi:hypothetical protein
METGDGRKGDRRNCNVNKSRSPALYKWGFGFYVFYGFTSTPDAPPKFLNHAYPTPCLDSLSIV